MMDLQIIQNKIFEIRGYRVMLDKDLAELYQVETSILKRAVRRNIERFPDDFMFELNQKELENLRYQFGISSWGGTRYQPFAFTQEGVAMLSSVLRSPVAIQVNISIMRAFVLMRQLAIGYDELLRKIEQLEKETNTQFSEIYQVLTELASKEESKRKNINERKRIGFNINDK
jgi:hypothetical protein